MTVSEEGGDPPRNRAGDVRIRDCLCSEGNTKDTDRVSPKCHRYSVDNGTTTRQSDETLPEYYRLRFREKADFRGETQNRDSLEILIGSLPLGCLSGDQSQFSALFGLLQ